MHALERVYGRAPPPHASSERRPAALAKGENGRPWFTTPRKPLPLQQTTLEWLALHIDWQQGAVRCAADFSTLATLIPMLWRLSAL